MEKYREEPGPPENYSRADWIDAYFRWGKTNDDELYWAYDLMAQTERQAPPEKLWPIVLDFIAAAPDPLSLGTFAAGTVEDLLRQHGKSLIDAIEAEAPQNPRLREAIAGVWIGPEHVGQEVFDRIRAVAEADPGNWPIGASGLPDVVEELLASSDIHNRRYGAKHLGSAPYTPEVRSLLIDFLHSGDEGLRETAASAIARHEDVSLLPDLLSELRAHSGVNGGTDLAWATYVAAGKGTAGDRTETRAAILAIAERGDDAMKWRARELFDPQTVMDEVKRSHVELLSGLDEFLADAELQESLTDEQRADWDKLRQELETQMGRLASDLRETQGDS